MFFARLLLRLVALILLLALGAYLFACVSGNAQTNDRRDFQPNVRRALASRTPQNQNVTDKSLAGRHTSLRDQSQLKTRPLAQSDAGGKHIARPPTARTASRQAFGANDIGALNTARIAPGTSLSRILHASQLSANSPAGSVEQYVDRSGDLVADERATFDASGGAFDVAVGASGTRYEVFTSVDPNDGARNIGVLVAAFDTNGDYMRDASLTYDLRRDFNLPSAVAVVSGTSRAGREFVVVSSSGFYNRSNPNDPDNEPTAGIVLLMRDPLTGGFDNSRSRVLVQVGSRQLNNANALALLPNHDLLIADFDSDELRVVRDTNNDGIPDTLDPAPYYSYRYSNDAPLDIAANSRGVVFSHSNGNSAVLLAIYDTDGDGRADAEAVAAEGLSLDNNLILHGLTVDRAGTVYVIEDATGASDSTAGGGNGGAPRIDAFPDPALDGFLRDGSLYAVADNSATQLLSGLAFGTDATLEPVGHLSLVNSASFKTHATRDGLATILGTGLTRGRRGGSASDASSRGVRVEIEGRAVPVHVFSDNQLNIYVPAEIGAGTRSVVVLLDGDVIAADDVTIDDANPGLFTISGTGAGEAAALLTSGLRDMRSPFPSNFNAQPSAVALFGTGWRNSLPVNVNVGGQAVIVDYAGASGSFPGLDQINIRLPAGINGSVPVVIRASNGATSRNDVMITIN